MALDRARAASTPLPGKNWLWQERCWFPQRVLTRRWLERASFSRQHCMLVYKPSPARLASVSVQFPHGAPFCRSTLVKTVSSSGRHASSSLAHAQTHFGFCSRQEGLDPQVRFTGRLLPGAALSRHDPPGRWDGSVARSRRGAHVPTATFGQRTAPGRQWRMRQFLLRER